MSDDFDEAMINSAELAGHRAATWDDTAADIRALHEARTKDDGGRVSLDAFLLGEENYFTPEQWENKRRTPQPANDTPSNDPVNHPQHYKDHPSGIECIQITEHMNFCLGNAVKYLWRAGLKGDAVEDLRKSVWYIEREIQRLEDDAA